MLLCFGIVLSCTLSAQALTPKQQKSYYNKCVAAERIIFDQYYKKTFNKKAPGYGENAEYIIFSMARSSYSVPKDFYDQYYKNLKTDLKKIKSVIDPQECAKLVLVLSAMGYNASEFKEYPLLKTMCKKTNIDGSDNYMKYATILLALDCGKYRVPNGSQYITRGELISQVIKGCYASTRMGIDIPIMNAQALAPYCKKYTNAKTAKNYVFDMIYSKVKDGLLYGVNANSWTNAQVAALFGQFQCNPLKKKSMVLANNNLIQASLQRIDFINKTHSIHFDSAQVARGFTATIRTMKKKRPLFDCTDALKQ